MSSATEFADVEVTSRDAMDDPSAFPAPWLVIYPTGSIRHFDTEGAACALQREHRRSHGRDPMTGDKTA